MELRRYLTVLRERWVVVLTTVVLCVAVAYVTAPRGATYVADATIVVGPRQFSTDPESDDLSSQRTSGLDRLLYTYSTLLRSEVVAADAIELTGVPRTPGAIIAQTTAEPVLYTQLLEVQVTDSDPVVAQQLANGMSQAFVNRLRSFDADATPAEGTLPEVDAYVFEQAQLPVVPITTDPTSRLLVAGLFGFLAAAALAAVLDHLDVTIRTAKEAEKTTGLPVLGVIPVAAQLEPDHRKPSPRGEHATVS